MPHCLILSLILYLIIFLIIYATYKSKNAIINANNPVASAKANPNIAYENNCPLKDGFLETPSISAPKTTPIPTPAPIKPVVAKPVPIIFAACIILGKRIFRKDLLFSVLFKYIKYLMYGKNKLIFKARVT